VSLTRQRELLVLSTLHAHPMHGYRLAEVLEAGLGPALGLKRPAIYAILKRFEARGWIEGEVEQDGAYPERLVYRTSSTGQAALPELAREACAAGDAAPQAPLVTLLAHLDLLPEDERRPVLERLRDARARHLASLQDFAGHDGHAGAAFGLLARHLRTELEVLEGLLAG
jgi:DNA-binding PadR family transcriptional regulator